MNQELLEFTGHIAFWIRSVREETDALKLLQMFRGFLENVSVFLTKKKWRAWERSQRILWQMFNDFRSGNFLLRRCVPSWSQVLWMRNSKVSEVLWPGRTWNMLRGFWSFLLSSASSVEHELSQAYLNGHNCLQRTWSTSISVGWRAFDMPWKPMPRCAELK